MKKVVYINDRPLIFAEVYDKNSGQFQAYTVLSEAENNLSDVIALLDKGKENGIVYLSGNVDESWKRLLKKYILIEAAGGLVQSPAGRFLFIFRNGKWDLPKGKAEYEETPEITALREVEEECGIDDLTLGEELKKTFHTYKEKGRSLIKVTHWYKMTVPSEEKLIPQKEEGITQAVWLTPEEAKAQVMTNTYSSIKELLSGLL
jgi:8-oxo-dGTP pyrophosphatase MutT (NUDIX family)